MVGEPPECQPLEILQGAGKDGGRCDGGRQGYSNGGGGYADPGRDGDVELHKDGYWDVSVSLCTGVGGSGGVGGSVGVGGTGGVASGSGGSVVGGGGGDSESGGSIGGS